VHHIVHSTWYYLYSETLTERNCGREQRPNRDSIWKKVVSHLLQKIICEAVRHNESAREQLTAQSTVLVSSLVVSIGEHKRQTQRGRASCEILYCDAVYTCLPQLACHVSRDTRYNERKSSTISLHLQCKSELMSKEGKG
jgi:hypothetical protein